MRKRKLWIFIITIVLVAIAFVALTIIDRTNVKENTTIIDLNLEDSDFKKSINDDIKRSYILSGLEFKENEFEFRTTNDFMLSDELTKKFNKLISTFPKEKSSFLIANVDEEVILSFNSDKPIPGASSIKLAYCLSLCKDIDEGNLNFDDVITYNSKYSMGGSGDLNNNSFNGQKYSLEHIMEKTISISDNTGYNILIHKFGFDRMYKMLDELGITTSKATYSDIFPKISALDSVLIMNNIYKSKSTTNSTGKLYDMMLGTTKTKYNNFIRDALGKENKVANKGGYNPQGLNDSGIVNDSYYIAVFTGSGSDYNRKKYVTEVARLANEAMIEYESYKTKN